MVLVAMGTRMRAENQWQHVDYPTKICFEVVDLLLYLMPTYILLNKRLIAQLMKDFCPKYYVLMESWRATLHFLLPLDSSWDFF